MDEITKMWDDDREIRSIWQNNDGEGIYHLVGSCGITKIKIYKECGQMSYVPWAAVYNADGIKYRIDMTGMGITYQ